MAQTKALEGISELLSDLNRQLMANEISVANVHHVLVELIVCIRALLIVLGKDGT